MCDPFWQATAGATDCGGGLQPTLFFAIKRLTNKVLMYTQLAFCDAAEPLTILLNLRGVYADY
jgi:hypothetical protein